MRQIILSVVVSGLFAFAACSSETETSKGTEEPKDDAGGAVSGDASPAPTSTNPPNQPPPPEGTCSGAQGADACFECCDGKHPGGSEIWDQAFDTCLCEAANCATECATSLCAATPEDPADGDDCSTCIENLADCEQQADTACAADTACKAFDACVVTSECEAEVDGGA